MQDHAILIRRAKLCRLALQTMFLTLAILQAGVVVSAALAPGFTGAMLATALGYPALPISGVAGAAIVAVVTAIVLVWLTALGQLACLCDPDDWAARAPYAPARAASRAAIWVSAALGLSILGQIPLSLLTTLQAAPGARMVAIALTPAHAMGLFAAVIVAFLALVLRLMGSLVTEQREII